MPRSKMPRLWPVLLGLLALLPRLPVLAAPAAGAGLLGRQAPDFTLPAAGGSNVRLSEQRGSVVIVAFWSSRCSVCAAQLAALDGLYNTYRSAGLIALAVSVDDDLTRALDFARAHAATYPLLIDRAKGVSRAFGIDRLPTTVLIDRAGNVRYLHADYSSTDASYVSEIRTLLDDAPAASTSVTNQ